MVLYISENDRSSRLTVLVSLSGVLLRRNIFWTPLGEPGFLESEPDCLGFHCASVWNMSATGPSLALLTVTAPSSLVAILPMTLGGTPTL